MVQDPEILLQVWVEHFQKLMKSRAEHTQDLCELKQKVEEMETLSHGNEDRMCHLQLRKLQGR